MAEAVRKRSSAEEVVGSETGAAERRHISGSLAALATAA